MGSRLRAPRAALLLLSVVMSSSAIGCRGENDRDVPVAAEESTWAYDSRKNAWYEAEFDPSAGDELLHDGILYFVDDQQALVPRGAASLAELEASSWFYNEERSGHGETPAKNDWVLVLGDTRPGHNRLEAMEPGQTFAWRGKVFASRLSVQGELEVRATGEGLSRVASTFKRYSPQLLQVTLDVEGQLTTLSVTDGHPFYLPDEDDFRPVGELPVGTALLTASGGRAVLVGVERRDGDFEVYNFEVEGLHNYYAGDAGVVVHNAKYKPRRTKCDIDWRGAGKTWREAVEKAFELTGQPREAFSITKWGRNQWGKSFPVQWDGPGGAQVNIDLPHKPPAPTVPHVGFQTAGKGAAQTRGHIFIDCVPFNR